MNNEIQETLPDAMCFCGPTVLIRRDCFEQAGYFFVDELASSEDYDICLRLSEVTSLANLERPLYSYRQHAGSVSTSKRQRQLINKAKALEQAAHRRYGPNPPQKFTNLIARDYLRAAVLGCNDDDLDHSREALEMALRYSPGLLDSASLEPTLAEVIRRSMPKEDLNFSLAYLECLFRDLFPKNSRLRQIEHHLVAELYIAEAFAQAQNSPSKNYDVHLVWKGIRYDPGWLANKGVLSLLVKQFVRLG